MEPKNKPPAAAKHNQQDNSQLNKMLAETTARQDIYTVLESSLENTSRVVETLPHPNPRSEQLLALKRELEDIRRLDKEAQSVTNNYYGNLNIDDVLRNDQRSKEQEALNKEDEMTMPLFGKIFALTIQTNQVMNDVIKEAHISYKSQERLYKIVTWISYVLYTMGWGLSVFGQLPRPA